MACPVVTVIDGLIAVADLRNEIGDPTLHQTNAGWISNDMLCNIIQRHHDETVFAADQRIYNFVLNNGVVGPPQLYDEVDLALSTSDSAVFTQGAIDTATYWPNVMQAAMDAPEEHLLAEDPELLKTGKNSYFARYRYRLVDNRIQVLPVTATSVKVSIANLQRTREFHIGGLDGIMVVNQKIIDDAKAMLAARIAEGTRLDPTEELDDGLIDDSAN